MTAKSTTVSRQMSQAKSIMIFILVMSLSGLADLIAELIPELGIGVVEIGISTFFFVPLALVILFNNGWAALAAPIGEIVFSDLVLGEFGGLGEFEEVILVTLALFIAGWMVKDPKDRKQVIVAGLVAYLVAEMPATFIDIFKVWVGVEALEAVEGLPQSVVALEGIDFLVEYVVTGVIFGAVPAVWLTRRLHGKIEPLMGIQPRSPEDRRAARVGGRLVIYGLIGLVAATAIAVVSELGFNIVEWEPEFLDILGEWFIGIPIILAAVAAAVVLTIRANRSRSEA